MYVPQRRSAQANRRGNFGEPAVHEHHVGSVDGYISTGAYGHAHVRPCERRCVVYAVAHHGDFAAFSELPYHAVLAVRLDSCDHLVHAGLRPDGLCRKFIVTRKHDHVDSHVTQLAHSLRTVISDRICNCDDAEEFSFRGTSRLALGEVEACLSFLSEFLRLGSVLFAYVCCPAHEFQVSAGELNAFQPACKTISGSRFKVRDISRFHCFCFGRFRNRDRQRMLAPALNRKSLLQQFFCPYALSRQYVRYLRTPFSYRSGLVQNNGRDSAGLLL